MLLGRKKIFPFACSYFGNSTTRMHNQSRVPCGKANNETNGFYSPTYSMNKIPWIYIFFPLPWFLNNPVCFYDQFNSLIVTLMPLITGSTHGMDFITSRSPSPPQAPQVATSLLLVCFPNILAPDWMLCDVD